MSDKYPAVGFSALFALRADSLYVIGFLFMITVMTDTFGYVVGVPFGKHKLAVKISPKKSIEGSIGGTLAATVLTMAYIYIVNLEMIGAIELNFVISLFLVIFISITGQVGDLIASKLKRDYNIKDYSNIFPGHGGMMDRFDSVLFASMVIMIISKVVEIL